MTQSNSGEQQTDHEKFGGILSALAGDAHGSHHIATLKDFFESMGTSKAAKILAKFMTQEPVRWTEVKERTWPEAGKAEENQFWFIQGDLISSQLVLLPGITPSRQTHPHWLVLSPTCDVIRADYINLAPAYAVKKSFKAGSEDEKDIYNNFNLAVRFRTSAFFPISFLKEDDPDFLGYLVDLREPAFLGPDSDRSGVVVIASLTVEGWHLLNICLKERQTRANLEEEISMRVQPASSSSIKPTA
ncbi:MAG: hypothetical protein JST16_06520 [Bdellovibrionales bacterium]|nr:hypothetical protein [Bdellovibrionales bacterium]